MTKYDDLVAHLKAMTTGEDKEEAKKAKLALAALFPEKGEPGGDEKKDEPKKDAEGGDEKKDEPKKEEAKKTSEGGDEPKKEDKEMAATISAMQATIKSLSASIAARDKSDEDAERVTLLSGLPDDVRAKFQKVPLQIVRDVVPALPFKRPAIVTTVQATLGAGRHGSQTSALPPEEKHALDVQMGLAPPACAIVNEGRVLSLGVMTPAAARAYVQARDAKGGK